MDLLDFVEVPATAADVLVIPGAGLLGGFSFRETTGAAVATFVLRDGTTNQGPIIASVSLTAAESTREWPGGPGIMFVRGVFLDVTAGSIEGAVYVVPAERTTGRNPRLGVPIAFRP